jgi:hypothetical protein
LSYKPAEQDLMNELLLQWFITMHWPYIQYHFFLDDITEAASHPQVKGALSDLWNRRRQKWNDKLYYSKSASELEKKKLEEVVGRLEEIS